MMISSPTRNDNVNRSFLYIILLNLIKVGILYFNYLRKGNFGFIYRKNKNEINCPSFLTELFSLPLYFHVTFYIFTCLSTNNSI